MITQIKDHFGLIPTKAIENPFGQINVMFLNKEGQMLMKKATNK